MICEDMPALGVNRVGNAPPARNMFGRVQAGREQIAVSRRARVDALADDQPGGGALPVIFHVQVGGHTVQSRALARHRGHRHAVLERDAAERQRLE